MDLKERELKLGFIPQKELIYNNLLPYSDKIDAESTQLLKNIKTYLGKAVALREINPGVTYWTWQLTKYIQLYGRKFSKEDHLALVHMAFQLVIIPELEMDVIQQLSHLLVTLLKKQELLTRKDLILPWRPLYDLYERILYSPYEHMGMLLLPGTMEPTLKNLVGACRVYFSADSTQEMLDEWRPLLCPFDVTMSKAMAYFDLFLPTVLYVEEHPKGFHLWFEEFMILWSNCDSTPSWENNLVWLFARLAITNIGFIDWDKYMPAIFTRLLRSFNLPGGSKTMQIVRLTCSFETNPVVAWIVSMLGGGSSCQQHINNLFKMLESYYHPSNSGKWMIKLQRLLYKLPGDLVKRLHQERFKKNSWWRQTPEKHKLTEQDITQFVSSMKNVVFLAIFSKGGCGDSAAALRSLSLLRPEIVIPPLLERMYSALETLTEPHRLTATMHCMVSVSRSLVKGGKYFPEGPSHVIPLLMSSLPGIDPNDIKKCMVTFQLISTYTTLVPLVNCSKAVNYRTDLTQLEHDLCLATADFEDFVLQFMDRCFILIENSSLENTSRLDRETERVNKEETFLGVALASTFTSILTQSSLSIFKAALKKLYTFITSHILETKVSGKLAANICRSTSRVNPAAALQTFLPHYTKLILNLTDHEEVLKEEKLDDELLFGQLIISEVVRCNGIYLIPYIPSITQVLQRTLHLTSKQGYLLACSLLCHTLKSLTMICAVDFQSNNPATYDDETNTFANELPIREWGKPGDLDDLKVEWHVPSLMELESAVDLLENFLKPELEKLVSFSEAKLTMTRDELQCSLNIVLCCVKGAGEALPIWEGENIEIMDSCVPLSYFRLKNSNCPDINFRDNSNIRAACSRVLGLVLHKILETSEDDTKSLEIIISCYRTLMFHWGVRKEDFDKRWKGFHVIKKAMEDKMAGVKKHIRALLVDRMMVQHESRMLERCKSPFTPLHKEMTGNLLKLSISHYSKVRIRAQEALLVCLQNFPFSYRLFVPQVVESIKKDPKIVHEEFKGSLYFLLGQKHNTILTVNDWDIISEVWPALVSSMPSEKPSIIKLIDQISESICKYMETIQLHLEIPDACVQAVKELWGPSKPQPLEEFPNKAKVDLAEEKLKNLGVVNLGYYSQTVESLLELAESGKLHWRHYQVATVMLAALIRHDVEMSPRGVNFFVKNLIHDSLTIRKQAISCISAILKQQKRPHPKREIDPELVVQQRPGHVKLLEYRNRREPGLNLYPKNIWLQYNSNFLPKTKETWDEFVFVHKTHIGYSDWPKPLMVYETDDKQPNLDRKVEDLSPGEVPILTCFNDSHFVESLIKFLSIEERKGLDKFNARRFFMFKGLFRNFGDTFLPQFLPLLQKLVSGPQESSQRCASEIIAGLIRGSKHWPFEKMENLRNVLIPLLSTAFDNIVPETVNDWGTCIATASESRDPSKYYWLYDMLMDAPIRDLGGSFLESTRLYLLLGILAQQEWRVFELLYQLYDYVLPHMTHSFQNVREKLSSILCNIYMYDIHVPNSSSCLTLAPGRENLILDVCGKLSKAAEKLKTLKNFNDSVVDQTEDQDKEVINLLKTTCKWLMSSIPRTMHSVPPKVYDLLPYLFSFQNSTTNEELKTDLKYTITMLGQALLHADSIGTAIATVHDTTQSSNWHSKILALSYLQLMVFSNMFIIESNQTWVEKVKAIVLTCLSDQRLEVREGGAELLGGLLHCQFIPVTDHLLDTFKESCKTKLRRTATSPNGGTSFDPAQLIQRHSGILGLCACVNAYPYDVPDFLPDILMNLGDHLNDPQPIPMTIKKTLSNFRRTHHDNWRDHKLKFSDDQLAVITDLLVSPSYYA